MKDFSVRPILDSDLVGTAVVLMLGLFLFDFKLGWWTTIFGDYGIYIYVVDLTGTGISEGTGLRFGKIYKEW